MAMTMYAHAQPSTLLPLLRTQLPASLVFIGTIMSNPDLQPVYANFPPRKDGPIDGTHLASLGLGEYDWLVTVALPAPSEQLRVHHALSGAPEDVQAAQLPRAAEAVCTAISELMALYPKQPVLGAVPELFGPAVRKLLDAPKRDTTYIYAPDGGWGASKIEAGEDLAGLSFDIGRPQDAQAVSLESTNLSPLDMRTSYKGCSADATPVLRPQRLPLARLLSRALRVRNSPP